jgi:hypothetical protein
LQYTEYSCDFSPSSGEKSARQSAHADLIIGYWRGGKEERFALSTAFSAKGPIAKCGTMDSEDESTAWAVMISRYAP